MVCEDVGVDSTFLVRCRPYCVADNLTFFPYIDTYILIDHVTTFQRDAQDAPYQKHLLILIRCVTALE
jgi:hypothetical protein